MPSWALTQGQEDFIDWHLVTAPVIDRLTFSVTSGTAESGLHQLRAEAHQPAIGSRVTVTMMTMDWLHRSSPVRLDTKFRESIGSGDRLWADAGAIVEPQ